MVVECVYFLPSYVRGYHVYQCMWNPELGVIGMTVSGTRDHCRKIYFSN